MGGVKRRLRDEKKAKAEVPEFKVVSTAGTEEAEWVLRAGYRLIASWLLTKCRPEEGARG